MILAYRLYVHYTIWVPAGRDVFIETVDKRQLHADAHADALCRAWIQANGILCTILM